MSGANQTTAAWLWQWGVLLFIIFIMYFIVIRPQRKRDKETEDMRKGLSIGDTVVTIGGICGKIVKVTDDTIVIQGGADKTKFEIKKWAVSTVESKASMSKIPSQRVVEPEEEEKKVKPKRLGKKSSEEATAEAKADVEKAAETVAEEAAAVENAVETAAEEVTSEA